MSGISIPIAFLYNFRGIRYKEIEVYFSFRPVPFEERDLIEQGKKLKKKDLDYFFNKSLAGDFDFLVPCKVTESENYKAPYGMRFGIDLVDENPTTATLLNRIGMMPCRKNNLDNLIDAFGRPNFYISTLDKKLSLKIKSNDRYHEIPSQSYSHNCWQGFAHPTITLDGAGTPMDYAAFDWDKVLLLCQSSK